MKRADDVRAEHKLDAITHYLLQAFPGGVITLKMGNGGDVVLSVRSSNLLRTPTLHIAGSFLREASPAVDELSHLFEHLQLATLLRERGEHVLGSDALTH